MALPSQPLPHDAVSPCGVYDMPAETIVPPPSDARVIVLRDQDGDVISYSWIRAKNADITVNVYAWSFLRATVPSAPEIGRDALTVPTPPAPSSAPFYLKLEP